MQAGRQAGSQSAASARSASVHTQSHVPKPQTISKFSFSPQFSYQTFRKVRRTTQTIIWALAVDICSGVPGVVLSPPSSSAKWLPFNRGQDDAKKKWKWKKMTTMREQLNLVTPSPVVVVVAVAAVVVIIINNNGNEDSFTGGADATGHWKMCAPLIHSVPPLWCDYGMIHSPSHLDWTIAMHMVYGRPGCRKNNQRYGTLTNLVRVINKLNICESARRQRHRASGEAMQNESV